VEEGKNIAVGGKQRQLATERGGLQVTVSLPHLSWAAYLSQVTPETASSLPSQGWAVVGGAEVKTPG
jgi:hypothetical protein